MQHGIWRNYCLLACVLAFAGCAEERVAPFTAAVEVSDPFLLGLTNHRILVDEELRFEALGNLEEYSVVLIGTPQAIYTGRREVLVQLPDGTTLDLNRDGVVEEIKSRLPDINSDPATFTDLSFYDSVTKSTHQWPAGTVVWQIPPIRFYVSGDNLIGVHISGSTNYAYAAPRQQVPPRIGTTPENMTPLPITGQTYIELFGQPERVIETFVL